MSSYPRRQVPFIRQGDDFFRPASLFSCESDYLYLRVGQTDWHGPFSLFEDLGLFFRSEAQAAKELAGQMTEQGIHLHTQVVGLYIRTRRLPHGPAKKLADWHQLPAEVPMLVNPYPNAYDIKMAKGRVRYLRYQRLGSFRTWTDDAGALWTERL